MERKKTGLRPILTASVFIAVIGFFFTAGLLTKPPEIIASERRGAAKMPAFSAKTLISGEFMRKFESYAADSIPLREKLRTLRAAVVFDVFMQTDKDGLYNTPEGAGKFTPLDADSVSRAADAIKRVADSLPDMNIYYAFVPDKSVYVGSRRFPGFDPQEAESLLTGRPGMEELTFISLTDALCVDDFYKTDLHWDQTKISGVTDALGAVMGFEIDLSGYTKEYAGKFFGVYAGQVAMPMAADDLYYLSLPDLTALYLNENTLTPEYGPVYDIRGFEGNDPYDIFLRGVQPLVILENSAAAAERELYIFRDSFSSSLAPVLACAYSKIILIDLRYLDFRMTDQFFEFKPGSDALFLYGSQILNNSAVLRA